MVVFARVHLGMRRREFGRLSPRVFAKMCRSEVASQNRASLIAERSDRVVELMLSQLCAIAYNAGFRPKEARSAEAFELTKGDEKMKSGKPKRLTKKQKESQQAAGWARYNASRAAYLENSRKAGQQVVVTASA